MKKLLSFILVVFFFAIILACLVIYYIGVPYCFYVGFGGMNFAWYLVIWFGIHLIRRIIQTIVLKRRLKQYDQINKILGGK